MPKAIVRGVASFEKILGVREIEFEIGPECTVNNLIAQLDTKFHGQLGKILYKKDGQQSDTVRVFLNGRDVRFLDQPDPLLKDGDIILFLPVLAGG